QVPLRAPQGLLAASVGKPVKQARLHAALRVILASAERPVAKEPVGSEPRGVRDAVVSSDADLPPCPLRVLVAEDNAVNQLVVKTMLQRLGYRPDVVGDGCEAVEALARQHYDVVLMDLHMPIMGGLEATRAIRQTTG